MHVLILAFIILLVFMSCAFLTSLLLHNNNVIDVAYGTGFCLIALYTFFAGLHGTISLIATLLVLLWGVRLAVRIGLRNWKKPEDFRYAVYRKRYHPYALNMFFKVYLVQTVIIFLVCLPVCLVNIFYRESPTTGLVLLGGFIWVVGYLFEVVGDYQLDTFLHLEKKPTKYIENGLWRYTRHPNYFGEATMWWGLAIFALGASRYGLTAFVSPIIITLLLLKISGVPLLEKRWAGDPAWEKYKRKTSKFIPLPSKK
jgi:steroid 5-alpha reductase family enzyme